MNFTEKAKKYVYEVWERTDRTTKLEFSDETGRFGECFYNSTRHAVHICPKSLYKQFAFLDLPGLTFKEFIQYIAAHEFAHSNQKSKEKFPVGIDFIITSGNDDLIIQYRKFVLLHRFKREANAWINSRKFLAIQDKELFYAVVRFCLHSYKKYEDVEFETKLYEYRSSQKKMFADALAYLTHL